MKNNINENNAESGTATNLQTSNARLRQFRINTGLSQRQFAQTIKINPSFFSDVENERRTVTQHLIGRIQKHFSLSSDWIFTGEGTNATYDKKVTVSVNVGGQKVDFAIENGRITVTHHHSDGFTTTNVHLHEKL